MEPFLAYETLLDCVYLTARVATMRSVSACVGTYGTAMIMCYGKSVRTYLFVLGDEVFEELGVDFDVVSALLEADAVDLARLDI
jgi:hypothetical protein